MKKIFAVGLLLLSFAAVALADGGGGWPPAGVKSPKSAAVHLADGGGGWPPSAQRVA